MTWETDDVELVPIHELLPHEETKSKNQQKLHQMTIKWGGYTSRCWLMSNLKLSLMVIIDSEWVKHWV